MCALACVIAFVVARALLVGCVRVRRVVSVCLCVRVHVASTVVCALYIGVYVHAFLFFLLMCVRERECGVQRAFARLAG